MSTTQRDWSTASRDDKLSKIADQLQWWLDYNVRICGRRYEVFGENDLSDDMPVALPLNGPTQGMLKDWMKVLRQADPLCFVKDKMSEITTTEDARWIQVSERLPLKSGIYQVLELLFPVECSCAHPFVGRGELDVYVVENIYWSQPTRTWKEIYQKRKGWRVEISSWRKIEVSPEEEEHEDALH